MDLLDAFQIKEALAELHLRIPVPYLVVHTRYWALAYGDNATKFLNALKAGVSMATTRFCYGDDFTVEDYNEIGRLPPSEEGSKFADYINKLAGDSICCVPVVGVDQSNGVTVGLGDTFVAGFLPALLPYTPKEPCVLER